MAENMNVQLTDEMMSGATGGFTVEEQKMPDYDAIGVVMMHMGGKQYQVRFDDGAEVIATDQGNGGSLEGARVGLYAVAGGWTMYVLNS